VAEYKGIRRCVLRETSGTSCWGRGLEVDNPVVYKCGSVNVEDMVSDLTEDHEFDHYYSASIPPLQ
jgi:hypothetical protein